MFVHANIATVPAFAPVHEYADWYWAFLETKPDMVLHPTCPLPEVVAWHREHAPGKAFDDFIPGLTFDRFDADDYAQLLDDAGMRYLVHVTKHHDGFCWWDTAYSERSSARLGPKRDVTAELSAAVRRKGHRFGCYYSLLDWSHPDYPDQARYVDDVHAAAAARARRAVRARGLVGRRSLGPSGWSLARGGDRRRRPRRRGGRRLRDRVQRPVLRVGSRLRRLRVRRARRSRPGARGSCAGGSATRSA